VKQQLEFDLKWEGRRCVVTELASLPARQLARRLANIIGKAMRDASKGVLDLDVQMIGMLGIGSMLEQLDDDTSNWLTNTFAAVTYVEREAGGGDMVLLKDVQELVFRGSDGLARWARWLAFCIEASCGDFFVEAFAEAKKLLPQQTAKASTATATTPASASLSTSSSSGNFTA
jgi:hypothetical protein